MKKVLSGLVALLVLLSIAPFALATSIGTGAGITMETEDFPPLIWMCDNRVVTDDNVEPGHGVNLSLAERQHNYAFEGEQISWDVLVMDKNGEEKISDVYVTIGSSQGEGNDIEVNCDRVTPKNITSCNARILEEEITAFDPETMRYYECTFTVETPASMYGEYWVTAEVEDLDGLIATFDENEYWYLNPVIALTIDGDIDFGIVRPGTQVYSDTLLLGNDADDGSGVMLELFVAGTDFYDPSSSGAKCPTTNQLSLSNFAYYATNGAYSTFGSAGGTGLANAADAEGYVRIPYGERIDQGEELLGNHDLFVTAMAAAGADAGNTVSPGSEVAITFRLALPEPCNGDFSEGSIYFFGEAI